MKKNTFFKSKKLIMSELNKKYVHESLSDFLKSHLQLPKTLQIIPYAYIRSTKEVLSIATLNEKQVLTDFGGTYKRGSDILNYVVDNIALNSFGVLPTDREYVLENSSIAYVLNYDVKLGCDDIHIQVSPTIFVRYEFERSDDLEELLKEFAYLYANKINGTLRNDSLTSNIVFMKISDLYYTCRGTTVKKIDRKTGNELIYDINEYGFPADQRITNIYKSNPSTGDIPLDGFISELANCCPEVDFYINVSNTMSNSLFMFFDVGLPILEKHNRYIIIEE